ALIISPRFRTSPSWAFLGGATAALAAIAKLTTIFLWLPLIPYALLRRRDATWSICWRSLALLLTGLRTCRRDGRRQPHGTAILGGAGTLVVASRLDDGIAPRCCHAQPRDAVAVPSLPLHRRSCSLSARRSAGDVCLLRRMVRSDLLRHRRHGR